MAKYALYNMADAVANAYGFPLYKDNKLHVQNKPKLSYEQAIARNEFLEAKLSETVMNAITEQEILERQKLVYVPFVTDLLNDYVADRKAYRTIEDFLPELEEGLCDLAK